MNGLVANGKKPKKRPNKSLHWCLELSGAVASDPLEEKP